MLNLKPAVYSKAQTVNVLLEKLAKAPKQVCNTPEAFAGNVMEFIMDDGPLYGQPVGSLDEYFTSTHHTAYTIHLQNGVVIVERLDDGTFVARAVNINQEELAKQGFSKGLDAIL